MHFRHFLPHKYLVLRTCFAKSSLCFFCPYPSLHQCFHQLSKCFIGGGVCRFVAQCCVKTTNHLCLDKFNNMYKRECLVEASSCFYCAFIVPRRAFIGQCDFRSQRVISGHYPRFRGRVFAASGIVTCKYVFERFFVTTLSTKTIVPSSCVQVVTSARFCFTNMHRAMLCFQKHVVVSGVALKICLRMSRNMCLFTLCANTFSKEGFLATFVSDKEVVFDVSSRRVFVVRIL